MIIVNWNCNGAFRKKCHLLDIYDADILIIQECENPQESTEMYKKWAGENYLWLGKSKNKGLGIFSRKDAIIEPLEWSNINTLYKNENLESFLPCRINNSFVLLAVWTKHANSEVFGYIGQFWKYLQLHKNKFMKENMAIVGDFNSNAKWDKWDRWWNHSDVIRELSELNIQSLYHFIENEEQGEESTPTFYLQKNLNKPYHIDYAFLSPHLLNEHASFGIANVEEWLQFSDHMPIKISFS